jgi:septal ring factor EnvC (AmiA/AmiB activator)
VSRALLSQADTPVTAAAQLSAQLAVSPSVLTPGVAQAMADAGEAVSAAVGHEATANLDKIKAKLAVLKQHIGAKTKRMSDEKRRQIEAQIEKLEKSLAYVEKQRVSLPVSAGWGACWCLHVRR